MSSVNNFQPPPSPPLPSSSAPVADSSIPVTMASTLAMAVPQLFPATAVQ